MIKLNELTGKRGFGFKGIDQVGSFWVVTKIISSSSTIDDILFECNVFDFVLQINGGLDAKDILLITQDKKKAQKVAEEQL